MKKLYAIITVVIFLLLVNSQMAKAQEVAPDTKAPVDMSKPQDAGNKTCPVSGEKIDDTMKATYEYDGKVYNFCCAACIIEFKKDPQKYIKKVEQELENQKGE